jgi:uncharacterized membrane protein
MGSAPASRADTVVGSGARARWALALVAAVGLAISAYLLAVRLAGELPACGITAGCETVQTSEYSELFGIPVAAFGVVFSAIVLVAGLVWWRRGDRRALYVAYGIGILGTLMVAYLTYLELFVIHAICTWCVAYGTTVVLGFILAIVELRRSPTS